MRNKPVLFVYKIHALNYLLINLLKIKYKVIFYKDAININPSQENISQIKDFKDLDHWLLILNESYVQLAAKFNNCKVKKNKFLGINFEKYTHQHLFIMYQQYLQFTKLIQAEEIKNYYVLHSIPQYLIENFFSDISLVSNDKIIGRWLLFTEFISLFKDTITNWLKFLKRSFTNLSLSKNFKFIMSGIGQGEMPEGNDVLNFAWPTINKICSSDEILYIVPCSANENFIPQGSQYCKESNLISYLPLADKINIHLKCFFYILYYTFNSRGLNYFLVSQICPILVWKQFLKRFKPQIGLTSLTNAWPEQPESAIFNELNIRNVIWFYSSGEFYYSKNIPNFHDINIRFSLVLAKELWVWNKEIETHLSQRKINPIFTNHIDNAPLKFIVTGPLLFGNFNFISEKSSVLKEKLSLSDKQFVISFFDISPMVTKKRLDFGVGPFVSLEMIEAFYDSILKLADDFPNIHFLLKPKRIKSANFYDIQKLTQIMTRIPHRVTLCRAEVDPYIPIMASDLIISTMITSPTLMARDLGKTGYYYSPLGQAIHFSASFPQNLILKNYEELKLVVTKQLNANISEIGPTWNPRDKLKQLFNNCL